MAFAQPAPSKKSLWADADANSGWNLCQPDPGTQNAQNPGRRRVQTAEGTPALLLLRAVPCTRRAKKVAWKDKLIAPTQLIHLDVDHVDAPALKALVITDPSVVFAFISPSGDGLKLGIASAGIADTSSYSATWRGTIEAWKPRFPDAQFKEDDHVKFLHALCFVSHDPALYVNDAVVPFLFPSPSSSSDNEGRKEGRRNQKGERREGGGSDYDRVSAALGYIPNNDADYDTWLILGMALHSTNENWARDLWDEWSRQSGKYDERKQANSWASFSSDGQIIGSLFHLAQQDGYTPPSMREDTAAIRNPPDRQPRQWPAVRSLAYRDSKSLRPALTSFSIPR